MNQGYPNIEIYTFKKKRRHARNQSKRRTHKKQRHWLITALIESTQIFHEILKRLRAIFLSNTFWLCAITVTSVFILFLITVFLSLIIFFIVRYLQIPTTYIAIPFELRYSNECPSQIIDLGPYVKDILPGLSYDFQVSFKGPLSQSNVGVGNFPLTFATKTVSGDIQKAVEQTLHFTYMHPWALTLWSLLPQNILFPRRMLETLKVDLVKKWIAVRQASDPLKYAYISVACPKQSIPLSQMENVSTDVILSRYFIDRNVPQLNEGILEITAHLQGTSYYLKHHPIFSFIVLYPVLMVLQLLIGIYFSYRVYHEYNDVGANNKEKEIKN